jgi:hypothetical protein
MSSLIGTTSTAPDRAHQHRERVLPLVVSEARRADGATASLAESPRAQDGAGLDFFADLYFYGAAHHIPERVTLPSLGPQGSLDGEWSRDPDQSEVGSGVGTPCPVGA